MLTYVSVAGQVAAGAVYAAGVIGKTRGRTAYREFVRATGRLLPGRIGARRAGVIAPLVIAAEAATAVLTAALPRAGLVLAAALALVFTVAVAAALRRGERAPCRCFGASATPLGPRHIARNVLLLAVAATGAAASPPGWAYSVWAGASWAGLALAAGFAAMVALLVTQFDALIELFAPSPATVDRRR
ncbi:MauE/DoxX family redox-associated membrane protein [Spongiactinospora sp. TRM90649]|uniref:MauE/DoxX family redox-associated membrane protein n=1 Tax=Spongiactinospora sp. TRM90649 TaxID=3031114 RepID=UPI0023F8BAD4|nr:MauE/DoxX family redox-associated membrane protein [Spongiactinospora sp. TRM90649]MDF5757517.1 MauE/DoxX family redox-associated membrane protein [Spongiactinospora sp. TRM90649]